MYILQFTIPNCLVHQTPFVTSKNITRLSQFLMEVTSISSFQILFMYSIIFNPTCSACPWLHTALMYFIDLHAKDFWMYQNSFLRLCCACWWSHLTCIYNLYFIPHLDRMSKAWLYSPKKYLIFIWSSRKLAHIHVKSLEMHTFSVVFSSTSLHVTLKYELFELVHTTKL